MARANGHATAVSAVRRGDAGSGRSPAELLGVPANPLYNGPVPTNPPTLTLRGQSLYRASNISPALSVPSLPLAGENVYPQTPRVGRANFDGQLWQRLVRAGNVYRVEDLAASLWAAGVGTRALGGKGADSRIPEARLREEFHAWAYEALIPAGAGVRIGAGDELDEEGLGVFRDRASAQDYVRSRRGRINSQRASLISLAHKGPLWLAASPKDHARWPVENAEAESVQRVLEALAGGWRTNTRLAEAVFEEELAELTGAARERALTRKASSVRKLVHQMRAGGIPVIASPGRGYRLAEHMGDLEGYFAAEAERMRAVEEQAGRVELAAALWWPESDAEHASARAWRSAVRENQRSPQSLKRAQQRRERERSQAEERRNAKREAAERELELMATPAWASARHKRFTGERLTPAEQELEKTLKAVRRQKKSGTRPPVASGQATASSAKPRSSAPVEPPPWL